MPGGTIMAEDHREETPETGARLAGQHAPVSRRAMLRTAAGASAAGLVAGGAFAALPAAAAARPSRSQPSADRTGRSAASTTHDAAAHPGREDDGPLVIHVRDARTGEMDIFAGTTRTRLRDPELAARLARASR
jgi:hypothetical protein